MSVMDDMALNTIPQLSGYQLFLSHNPTKPSMCGHLHQDSHCVTFKMSTEKSSRIKYNNVNSMPLPLLTFVNKLLDIVCSTV